MLLEYLGVEAGRLLSHAHVPHSGVEGLINRVSAFRNASGASSSPETARFWAVSISVLPVKPTSPACCKAKSCALEVVVQLWEAFYKITYTRAMPKR